MPILAQESSIYPPDLLDTVATETGSPSNTADDRVEEDEERRRWWLLRTRSRQEKAVSRQLLSWKVPFYLPLVAQNALRQGRRRTSYLPLFTGYVCLYGNNEERVQALKTNRLLQVIEVVDQQQLVSDLSQLHRLINADAPVTIESKLQPGQRVRVKGGALEGLEGTILQRRGEDRLLVAVTCIGQGISMQIEDFMVEPC